MILAVTTAYAAIAMLIAVAIVIGIVILMLGRFTGTKRSGPIKDDPYESGMPPVGDARRRFNVRFYLVAMLFLLFDVEVVLLWPWAPVFYDAAVEGRAIGEMGVGKGFLLAEMAVFFIILLVGYVYAWRKGVFQWD